MRPRVNIIHLIGKINSTDGKKSGEREREREKMDYGKQHKLQI